MNYECQTDWPEYKVMWLLCEIPSIFTTSYSGSHPKLCRAALNGALHSIMGNVEADFRKKAAHGTGFDGDQWAPLSPRRVKKRLEKTRDFYLKKFGSRLPKKKEARGDVGYAEGGELPILIDEGDLVRSLSQGVINGAGQDVNYTATEHQEIALTDPNVIEMDTTVSGAHAHQEGSSSGKHPPQRRIVPDKIPDTWLEEATGVVAQIICEFIVETLQGPEPR